MKYYSSIFAIIVFCSPVLSHAAEAVETVEAADVTDVSDSSDFYGTAFPVIDHALNLHTARTLRPGSLNAVIVHRTREPIIGYGTDNAGDAFKNIFHDYFGFDGGGLKIGLGVRLGIVEGLDAGIGRLNDAGDPYDTWQIDAKWRILNQEKHPLDLALRAGASLFTSEGSFKAGALGQLIVNRLIAKRYTLGASLLFHSRSYTRNKRASDTSYTLGAGAFMEARFSEALGLVAEGAWGFAGYHAKNPTFSLGPKIFTNRHTFSIVLSNTQYVFDDGILANTDRRGKGMILGFNITREL